MIRSLIITLVFVLVSVSAFAADTATVNVSAVVQGTCTFDTTAYNMNFPLIDGATTGDVTAAVNLAFTCSNGTPITLDDVSGAQTLVSGSGNMAYAIDAYAAPATGTGATQNLAVTGRILEAVYSVAAADTYTDTLTININP